LQVTFTPGQVLRSDISRAAGLSPAAPATLTPKQRAPEQESTAAAGEARDREAVRGTRDWTQVPDIPLEPGERAESVVTVWLSYDVTPERSSATAT
jgi:hypothetical protein